MSDQNVATPVVADAIAIEEQKAKIGLRVWLTKAFASAFIFAFVVIVSSVGYTTVVKGESFDHSFIAEFVKGAMTFMSFVLG